MSNTPPILRLPTATGVIEISKIIIPERIRTSDERHISYIQNDLAQSILTEGLINPITLEDDHLTLRAGYSRLKAFEFLNQETIPYNTIAQCSPADKLAIEFAENEVRHPMSWQDRALAIRQIHLTKRAENPGTTWGFRESGRLFKLDFSHVRSIIVLAEELLNEKALPPDAPRPITSAPTITEAEKLLAAKVQQRLQAKLIEKGGSIPVAPAPLPGIDTTPQPTSSVSAFDSLLASFTTGGAAPQVGSSDAASGAASSLVVDLGLTLSLGSCLDVMWNMQPEQFDAILTDPPYGNELDEVEGLSGMEFVKQHGTEWGSIDMEVFFQRAYKVLRKNAWCFVFYDLRHHEKMIAWANAAGFKTQDYPNVWLKTHPCRNQSPATNWTKATEWILVCRKGNAVKMDLAYAPNFFACDGLTEKRKSQNPYAKPFEVCDWLMKPWVLSGMKVLDPFMGGGSILKHILRLGAVPYGIDIDERNFNEAATTLETAYRMLLGSGVQVKLPQVKGGME